MAATFPPESAWKTVAQKHKLKDNGLQKALAIYEKLGEDKHEERIKALDAAKKLAGSLAGVKEVAANAEASKFLDQLKAAAESTKKLVAGAAAKAGASEKKPDFSKLKALAGEVGKLAALCKAEKGGADAAKDGAVMQCLSHFALVAAAASAVYLALDKVLATAALVTAVTWGRTIPLLIAAIGVCAGLVALLNDRTKKLAACLKAHNNPAQRVYEDRARQAGELHAQLLREKERLGRLTR